MPSRRHLYRSGTPALLGTGLYVAALAVSAVIALTTGDLGVLWRLTLFTEIGDRVPVTWPAVLILVLAGMSWAWALWQSLRGPLAGPPPEPDRPAWRLRVALYVAAAFWALYQVMPVWPWWAAALDALVMCVIVVLFRPVLGSGLEHARLARTAGLLGNGGAAAFEVLDVLDWPTPNSLVLACGLAGLIWTVLILRAQRHDGRWRPATVRYGIAALVVPFLLVLAGGLLASEGSVYADATAAAGALTLIWLTRSAHELASPHRRPPSRLPARPPAAAG